MKNVLNNLLITAALSLWTWVAVAQSDTSRGVDGIMTSLPAGVVPKVQKEKRKPGQPKRSENPGFYAKWEGVADIAAYVHDWIDRFIQSISLEDSINPPWAKITAIRSGRPRGGDLQVGDTIIRIQNTPIKNVAGFQKIYENIPYGIAYELLLKRGSELYEEWMVKE